MSHFESCNTEKLLLHDKDRVSSAAAQPPEPLSIRRRHKAAALFTGRRAILDRLSDNFSRREPLRGHVRRVFLLHGLGGSGKTQIALKFAEEFEDRCAVGYCSSSYATLVLRPSFSFSLFRTPMRQVTNLLRSI